MDGNDEINMMDYSDEVRSPQDQDDSTNGDSLRTTIVSEDVPKTTIVPEDEPYVGQQFESEAAVHAFYKAYALRVGFIVRQSKLSRSKRDGSSIGRILVCNKEGHRCPDKHEKIVRHRSTTRVGCKARLVTRKSKTGKWFVSRFVKEHAHPLTPGKVQGDLLDEYLSAEEKIRELSEEVDLQREQAETYKQHLDILFEQVEGQDICLSKKIQEIVNQVKEMEAEEKQNRDHLNHMLS